MPPRKILHQLDGRASSDWIFLLEQFANKIDPFKCGQTIFPSLNLVSEKMHSVRFLSSRHSPA